MTIVHRPKFSKKRKPFRDLEKDGVTYSFLAKFAHCREQARLTYVEGLSRAGIIDALDFGSAFHECLELLASGESTAPASIKQKLDGWLNITKKQRKLKTAEFARVRQLTEQVAVMFPYYVGYWKKKKGHEYRSDFVCQEKDFSVPHNLSSGKQILLRGRFDAIFRLKGKLWLMENKTKSMIDEEGLQASLSQDLQTMLYCHAIRLLYGETPEGVLYNVIRRPQLRQGKAETYPNFLNRIREDVADNPDKYFMRWEVSFAKNDLDHWVSRTLNPLLEQVWLWWQEIKPNPFDPFSNPNRIHHFANPEGLYTRYGRSEFFEFLTRNSMYGLYRRTK